MIILLWHLAPTLISLFALHYTNIRLNLPEISTIVLIPILTTHLPTLPVQSAAKIIQNARQLYYIAQVMNLPAMLGVEAIHRDYFLL
jgi:hypothetical protein